VTDYELLVEGVVKAFEEAAFVVKRPFVLKDCIYIYEGLAPRKSKLGTLTFMPNGVMTSRLDHTGEVCDSDLVEDHLNFFRDGIWSRMGALRF